MTGRTHLAGGLLAASFLADYLGVSLPERQAMMALAATGSLLPDIDHPGSVISKYLGPVSVAYNWLERRVMPRGMQHRGLTHTPILMAALYGLLWAYGYNAHLVALWLGTVSHLALDLLTVSGIPVLWPLTAKRLHVLRIHTGDTSEHRVYYVLWGLLSLRELSYYIEVMCLQFS